MDKSLINTVIRQVSEAGRDGGPLDRTIITRLIDIVLENQMPLADFETWLLSSANRMPSAEEIIGVVDALRQHMVPLRTSVSGPIVDTCGTGGDGSGTFNISTATALVVAAAGISVAKHGNRAVSSKTGSADVLEHFGVVLDIPVEMVAECLANVGICFCYAPVHHPAMAKSRAGASSCRKANGI